MKCLSLHISEKNIMKELTRFVAEHIGDDVTRLILDRNRWPDIDMDLAVNCIESRKKLKGKVQEWYDEPQLIFPRRLSAEQCSSSATGRYKAELAKSIIASADSAETEEIRIADLTGGLGVDSWYFSKNASSVLYCEMLPELCDAALHNFAVLGSDNIEVRNCAVISASEKSGQPLFHTPEELLSTFRPSLVYMDPARRGEGGKKVFLIEECTPDVLTLKEEIFRFTRHLLIKLSPMADISMVCERLGTSCREVHAVAAGGECKELLIWMDKEWDSGYSIKAVELHKDGTHSCFSFTPSEEKQAEPKLVCGLPCAPDAQTAFLFEPGKALMKAGAFNLISSRFKIGKLGKSTHYYIFNEGSPEIADSLEGLGKVFRIISCSPLDKRSIKAVSQKYPHAEVTARNIPMDTDTLRKKLGVSSSDNIHIFGLRSDSLGPILIVTTGA